MAVKRGSTRKRKGAKKANTWLIAFWGLFILVMAFLFIANREVIKETLIASGLMSAPETETTPLPGDEAANPAESSGDGASTPIPQPALPQTGLEQTEVIPPEAATESPAAAEPQTGLGQTRERSLYFVRVDSDGSIVRTPVLRNMPSSTSPLSETLNALLSGPSEEEKAAGVRTLIPEGTKILGATMNGSTAQINLSEDFRFNPYSQEGYMWSLRQMVWTATEFPTVQQVQLLIEGRQIDYLGEGIWIRGPLSRETI
jgi:hypothetical protein